MDLSRFPYLQGNYAPVTEERDFDHAQLRIEGEIPGDLRGAFIRNGPNVAYEPNHYVYPLDGDGMLHAVYFDRGKVHYRNRWVQTSHLKTERKFGHRIYGSVGRLLPVPEEVIAAGGEPSPLKNTANTNVILHGGKLLALWEGGFPHRLNAQLETLGTDDYDGTLKPGDAFFAHPKICPVTGEMVTCTQTWTPPYFTAQIFDRNARHVRAIPVEMPAKVVIHDLQITENYIVIFCPPAYADLDAALKGNDPFRWEAETVTRIAVIPRQGGAVRWFELPAFFSWHFCNGYEAGNRVVIDYVWMERIPFSQNMTSRAERQPRHMHRMVLDLDAGTASDEKVGDVYCEFPRVDDRRCGLSYRYGFATASNREWLGEYHGYNCTLRYDMKTGAAQLHEYGPEANAGEPVHVAASVAGGEEDGYLMCYVFNPGEGAFLSIISAADVAAGPVAKIHIPGRVPNGFHANWMNHLMLR
jgi:carotenoid cleavage dioxygenase-like enzyme